MTVFDNFLPVFDQSWSIFYLIGSYNTSNTRHGLENEINVENVVMMKIVKDIEFINFMINECITNVKMEVLTKIWLFECV